MYFCCIYGEEGDLHVLLLRHLEVPASPLFFLIVFFSLMLSCLSCLYTLYINPLSVLQFANIFSHSVGCLFVLSIISIGNILTGKLGKVSAQKTKTFNSNLNQS